MTGGAGDLEAAAGRVRSSASQPSISGLGARQLDQLGEPVLARRVDARSRRSDSSTSGRV